MNQLPRLPTWPKPGGGTVETVLGAFPAASQLSICQINTNALLEHLLREKMPEIPLKLLLAVLGDRFGFAQ